MNIELDLSTSIAYPDCQVLEVRFEGELIFAAFCHAITKEEMERRNVLWNELLGAMFYGLATDPVDYWKEFVSNVCSNAMNSDAYRDIVASGLIKARVRNAN